MSVCIAFDKHAYRSDSSDQVRRAALSRLYQRKAVVDELIRSLENYQRHQPVRKAPCIPFSVSPKCS